MLWQGVVYSLSGLSTVLAELPKTLAAAGAVAGAAATTSGPVNELHQVCNDCVPV